MAAGGTGLSAAKRIALVAWQSRDEAVLPVAESTETPTIGRTAAARLREVSDEK